jgi:hypothetical protein
MTENTLRARLHPIWVGGRDGYRYSVIFDGRLLVDSSREAEFDAARALLAQGYTGPPCLTARRAYLAPSSTLRVQLG